MADELSFTVIHIGVNPKHVPVNSKPETFYDKADMLSISNLISLGSICQGFFKRLSRSYCYLNTVARMRQIIKLQFANRQLHK